MIKRILFTLTILIPCVLSSLAQNAPVDIFIGSTNVFSNSWQSGFVTAPAAVTTGTPYEGTTHFLFDYNYTGWWGGGQLNINSWSSNSFVDFSKHTHLVIAYKAVETLNNSIQFQFQDSAGVTGSTITVATNTAAYKIDTIPLSSFVGATGLNLAKLNFINFTLAAAAASGSGQIYIDNVRAIDLVNVKAGATKISPYGSFNFGSTNAGTTTAATTFTIQNYGAAKLALTGAPKIAISGTNASEFTVNQTSVASPISGGLNTTFTIKFNPTTTGAKSAVITIANKYGSYPTSGNYVINLTGTATAPEINIKGGATSIASAGNFDFGSSDVGTSSSATTFTIENLGTGPLTLSGTPRVAISGTNAGDFTIDSTSLSSPIAASGTTSFNITFNPSVPGLETAAITISNDDSDEGTYVINLSGTGNASEINVQAASGSIASSGNYDFGSVVSGNSGSPVTFTIQNLGNIDLILSGIPRVSISGANAADFTIDSSSINSPVTASGSTSFTITFNPSVAGSEIAAITISNDDSDEGTYIINLTGTGTVLAPEINVKAGATSIASSGSLDFGSSIVGTATAATTFTIENLGTADLNLSGSPRIVISGANAADFTIDSTSLSAPVAASGTTNFTISFNPSATGSETAAITISNDDSDEGTYVINFTGTGMPVPAPEINITDGITNIASSDSYDFGSSNVGTSTTSIIFTIENLGTADLNLSGSPRIAISGLNATDFTIDSTSLSAPVAASGSTSFTVTFSPLGAGSRTASITISNDDSDESAYVINLTGTGTIVTGLSGNAGSDSYAVYPTPFADETTLKINSSLDTPITLKVADPKGNVVYTSEGFTNQNIVLGKELERGIYFVQVTYQNRTQLIKIVKI